jgi:hypothetical protein
LGDFGGWQVMVDAKGRQQQQLNIAVAVVRGGTYLVEAGIVDSSIWSGKEKKKEKKGRRGFLSCFWFPHVLPNLEEEQGEIKRDKQRLQLQTH